MLSFPPLKRAYLAPGATDMRKSFDTLAGLVQSVIEKDPLSGHLFAFCNRRKDRLKILFWDGSGYCLLAKRLERGRFDWPDFNASTRAVKLTGKELSALLGWADAPMTNRREWYDWNPANGDIEALRNAAL